MAGATPTRGWDCSAFDLHPVYLGIEWQTKVVSSDLPDDSSVRPVRRLAHPLAPFGKRCAGRMARLADHVDQRAQGGWYLTMAGVTEKQAFRGGRPLLQHA